MNDLTGTTATIINTSTLTPIEVALGIDVNGMTTAKRLYEFLELNPAAYARWFRSNILENEFAEESVDFFPFNINVECGGQASKDAKLTARFAKKLSMMQKNERGEEAREYFTRVEEGVKEMVLNLQDMSPELQFFIKVETEQRHQKVMIQTLDNDVTTVNEDLQNFKRDMPLLALEIQRITRAKNRKVVGLMGGKDSEAYKDNSLRGKVYRDLESQIRREFGVDTYKAIKRSQVEKVLEIIESYELPTVLRERVADTNAQIVM